MKLTDVMVHKMTPTQGDVAANLATIQRRVAEASSSECQCRLERRRSVPVLPLSSRNRLRLGPCLVTPTVHTGGAALAVFPELCLTGYGVFDKGALLAKAMTLTSDPVTACGRVAVEHNIAVLVSFPEVAEVDGTGATTAAYITVVVVDRTGARVAHHRKAHLWGDYERVSFVPGSLPFRPFHIDGTPFPLGVAICYELEITEPARCLALQGAKLILFPAACACEMSPIALIGRVRAMENNVFCVYCNHGFVEEPGRAAGQLEFPGGSFAAGPDGGCDRVWSPTGVLIIVCSRRPPLRVSPSPVIPDPACLNHPWTRVLGPWCAGTLLQSAPAADATLLVPVDPSSPQALEWSERNPYLRDRRPELYGVILDAVPRE